MNSELVLLNVRANDGSRHFFATPDACCGAIRARLAALEGARETAFLDGIIEMWLDFTFESHTFSINNQYGELWFFVSDARCPEAILNRVAEHFSCL